MTHTPGPWRASTQRYAVVADHPVPEIGGSDAIDYYGGHLIGESIAPQNIGLIAAAPELLEALKETLAIAKRDEFGDYVIRAEAAIAKAEGR